MKQSSGSGDDMSDQVYERHVARVRDPQGSYIDKMKRHADEPIPRDSASSMRCASFKAFDFVCRYITATVGIKKHRVYPALRKLGSDRCYNEFKRNHNTDVFSEITNLLRIESACLDYDVMMRSDDSRKIITTHTASKVYNVDDQTATIVGGMADGAGIRTSELNLYHAMHGLKVLIDNEPEFSLIADNEIIDDVMSVLGRTERSLIAYRDDLQRQRG